LAEDAQDSILIEPIIEELFIPGKATAGYDKILSRLSTLELFYVKESENGVVLLRVESRDIQKRPFLFFIIELGDNGIRLQYSIARDASLKMRRLYVIKMLVSVLALIPDAYSPSSAELFQHIDSAIDDLIGSIPPTYSALYNSYDSLYNEYKEIRRLNIELTASNKNLTVQAMQLSEENKELKERLKELETYTEESLMVKVQDWIESHGNTIDLEEFSKALHVPTPRIEQILNKMVSMGYIEARG
jgi:uncharacterized membrane protein